MQDNFNAGLRKIRSNDSDSEKQLIASMAKKQIIYQIAILGGANERKKKLARLADYLIDSDGTVTGTALSAMIAEAKEAEEGQESPSAGEI